MESRIRTSQSSECPADHLPKGKNSGTTPKTSINILIYMDSFPGASRTYRINLPKRGSFLPENRQINEWQRIKLR
ncbi:hypothetical protein LEP1GSC047_0980 [Leptospira inadai serovar Lyme str. 10]|uniref:Uncharacterized protein n=1 Tax=Leptospira inadai serovar Lyme str. 10 TaxID=1049790 RepID=V6HGV5_9LEPT|nr:hypothetical protein LEP1GSC047_0980 [Leptospira inadai serovar Lyme str. 10]